MNHKILLIAFVFYSHALFGQEKYSYEPSVEGFEYIEVVKGKDNGRIPLLIAFHYSSGIPSETITDYDLLKNPVRIIVAKGNHRKRDGFSYFPVDYYKKDSLTQAGLARITVDSIARFVESIERKYNQKAIVSGISQGGDIAFLLAVYYPELCKASFPFAAVIHSNLAGELSGKPVKKIPIHLFQGESDPIVSVLLTRKRVKEIGNGLELKLYTYPELGHDISPQMKVDYSKLIDKVIED